MLASGTISENDSLFGDVLVMLFWVQTAMCIFVVLFTQWVLGLAYRL